VPVRFLQFFDLSLRTMRKYLAVLFLIIFSFQVLPLKVVGKLLVKGQTEEDVKGDCDDDADIDGKVAKYNDFILHPSEGFYTEVSKEKTVSFIVHRAYDLPVSYVADIISPPPNCLVNKSLLSFLKKTVLLCTVMDLVS